MPNIDKNVRYNRDFKYLMFHQSEHVRPVTGAEINAAAVQEGFFGVAQDIVINTNGQYDLTPRWIRASSPTQYEKNVPLYKIFKYTMHDISDSCAKQQMNYQAVHILLVGNFDDAPPTIAQRESVRKLLLEAVYQLPTLRDVLFHSEVEGISCPGIFMRPNKDEVKQEFSNARVVRDVTIFEPVPNLAPVLSISSSSTSQIVLVWTSIAAATSYKLYRKEAGVDSDFVFLTSVTPLTYTDTDVSAGGTYSYFVTAVLPVTGEGPTSNVVSVTLAASVNPNDYMYIYDSNGFLYTVGITDRLNPTYVGTQDFSASFVLSGRGPGRMFISQSPNNLLYLSNGSTDQTDVYVFDYTTNRTSLLLKSSIKLGANGTEVIGGFLYRDGYMFLRARLYVEVWDTSSGVAVYVPGKSVYDAGNFGGIEHTEAMAFDPDGAGLYCYWGGDDFGIYAARFSNYIVSSANAVTTVGRPGSFNAGKATHAALMVQRRMPANPNVLWVLNTANWGAYVLPTTVSPTRIGTVRAYGTTDNIPNSSQYGRCYIVDNRYMFLTLFGAPAGGYGCYVWDVNDPTTPVSVGGIGNVNSGVCDIVITEYEGVTYAYLIGSGNKTITIVNITNIAAPVTVSTTTIAQFSITMQMATGISTARQYTGYNRALPSIL